MTQQEQLDRMEEKIDRLFAKADEFNARCLSHSAATDLRLSYLERAVFGALGILGATVCGVAWVLVKAWGT